MRTIHVYCPVWVKSNIRHLDILLLRFVIFFKNRTRKNPLHSYARKLRYIEARTVKVSDILKVKNAVVNIGMLRHEAHHLQFC